MFGLIYWEALLSVETLNKKRIWMILFVDYFKIKAHQVTNY